MKILLNVNREMLDEVCAGWQPLEGIKLEETPDGSFDLIVTRDLELARETDARCEALRQRVADLAAP